MKSLLREMDEKFRVHEETCDCGQPDCPICNPEDLDEQNVTGAIAGYNTPAAFAKPGKWKSKNIKYESAEHVSKKYKPGHYQTIEFDEEVQNDKFPFAIDEKIWWNKEVVYPSKDITNSPGTSHKKDRDQKKITAEDVLEKKYLELIEGYRDYKKGDVKPSHKVKDSIREIAKKLQEIETIIGHTTRLKTESGVAANEYGPAASKALTKISERLIKISERVRSLGE
jgi:hypothetical protein